MCFSIPEAHDTEIQREGLIRAADLEQMIKVHLTMNSSPSKKLYLRRSGSLPIYLCNRVFGRDTYKVLKEGLQLKIPEDSRVHNL